MSGLLLIIDQNDTRRVLLTERLQRRYYRTIEASDAGAALAAVRQSQPALILLNADAPAPLGLHLCAEIKALAPETQVLIYTDGEGQMVRHAALQAGGDDFLILPRDDEALFARLRSMLRLRALADEMEVRRATALQLGVGSESAVASPSPGKARIMLTGRTSEAAKAAVNRIEEELSVECILAPTGFEAMRQMEKSPPDLVIVAEMTLEGSPVSGFAESESGIDLIGALSAVDAARDAPILFLTDEGAFHCVSKRVAAALDAGAVDCAYADENWEELTVRVRSHLKRKRYADRLRSAVEHGLRNSVRDPLTQLHNRRYLETHFERRFKTARALKVPLSVLLFDIDHFKTVNDTFGHGAGDAALVRFARLLESQVRVADLVARYGGDEFLVVMPGATIAQAEAAAHRVHQRTAAASGASGETKPFTVSVGVASLTEADLSPDDIIQRADAALMDAKSDGRDRVICA